MNKTLQTQRQKTFYVEKKINLFFTVFMKNLQHEPREGDWLIGNSEFHVLRDAEVFQTELKLV